MRRILLDHCVPKPLRRWLPKQNLRTCHEEGWAAFRNGELLAAAEAARFEIFITADKNLRYQQNLASRRLAIIELLTNRLSMLPVLAPALLQAITNASHGSYQEIPIP